MVLSVKVVFKSNACLNAWVSFFSRCQRKKYCFFYRFFTLITTTTTTSKQNTFLFIYDVGTQRLLYVFINSLVICSCSLFPPFFCGIHYCLVSLYNELLLKILKNIFAFTYLFLIVLFFFPMICWAVVFLLYMNLTVLFVFVYLCITLDSDIFPLIVTFPFFNI